MRHFQELHKYLQETHADIVARVGNTTDSQDDIIFQTMENSYLSFHYILEVIGSGISSLSTSLKL